jgi:heat shock protein 4
VTKTELAVQSEGGGLPKAALQELAETERAMELRDREVIETAEAKNSMEGYIYDTRSKVDGRLAKFISAEVRKERERERGGKGREGGR